LGFEPKMDFADIPVKNQISIQLRFIERFQTINIDEMIADIKLIHETYRIFGFYVKY